MQNIPGYGRGGITILKEYKRITVAENCHGCFACEVACKQEHSLPVGPRWIRVYPDMREVGGQWRLSYFVTECGRAAPAPCQLACPAGLNAWHYVSLASQGKFKEALEVIRKTTPFAGVLGRVCTRPCELDCERGKVDVPVAIRALKRFLADHEMQSGREKATPVKQTKDSQVAIIGSGPTGLSCAYDLIRQGYPVTVFETDERPGGQLRYGIPENRLPKQIVDDEIGYIEELGVEIKTNTPIKDLSGVLSQEYQAIFLAAGAHLSQKMEIPGEDTEGVTYALDFLKRLNSGQKVTLGEKVAVIGGGNTAVDAARVALHMGVKEVSIIYRRSRAEMPAMAAEVEEAEREGVKVDFLAVPTRILSKGNQLTGIECVRMELGEYDASGRRSPVPVRGSQFNVDIDNLLVAVSESVDKAMLPEGLKSTERGTVHVNPHTLQTNVVGVFAGGDVVTGPRDVVGAIAAGKEAAVSIDRYLSGMDLREDRSTTARVLREVTKGDSIRTVTALIDEKKAIAEAKRCLNCGVCAETLENGLQTACVNACPSHCIYYRDIWEITPKTGPYL
ncbi:MAG: FAD-dependent oxidoreductase [Dehalococcoidales bacterium]|nr:MAG: FAD-dependent oxidoreductase [Dehalococcoidales bacterium]